MRPDPINWGFVNSCVLTVTAAVLLCEPWRGDEGCEALEEAHILFHSAPAAQMCYLCVCLTTCFYFVVLTLVLVPSAVPCVAVYPSEGDTDRGRQSLTIWFMRLCSIFKFWCYFIIVYSYYLLWTTTGEVYVFVESTLQLNTLRKFECPCFSICAPLPVQFSWVEVTQASAVLSLTGAITSLKNGLPLKRNPGIGWAGKDPPVLSLLRDERTHLSATFEESSCASVTQSAFEPNLMSQNVILTHFACEGMQLCNFLVRPEAEAESFYFL